MLLLLLLLCGPRSLSAGNPPIRLLDFSGRPVDFAAVQRDATLIAFWMASCVPCVQEMPLIEALHKKSAGDPHIAIIGINLDDSDEVPAAQKIVAEQKVTYPMLRDPQRALVKRWFPKNPEQLAVPMVLVVDRALHAVYAQGFRPGTTAEEFAAEWSPQLAAAQAGQLREPLRVLPRPKGKPTDPAQMAPMLEKMLRSKHPDLSDAEIKKRLDAALEALRAGRAVSFD